jgi:uncharacterized protein YjbI with pentapeptide repeats
MKRFRSLWQLIKQHPFIVTEIIVVSVLLVALIVVEVRANGTGFAGKTLWDWLQLLAVLAIPLVVGFGVAWFTRIQQLRDQEHEKLQRERDQQLASQRAEREKKAAEQSAQTERYIAQDNQQEMALQAYIDKMSDLLIHEKLRESAEEDEVRKLARVRTLTILTRLDSDRKRNVLLFLNEAGLLYMDKRIIDLSHADLSHANLRNVNLSQVNPSFANLHNADLSGAYLIEANLSFANLHDAKLFGAHLEGVALSHADLSGVHLGHASLNGATLFNADLSEVILSRAILKGANLSGVTVRAEQVEQAKSLEGTTMPDGSIHP